MPSSHGAGLVLIQEKHRALKAIIASFPRKRSWALRETIGTTAPYNYLNASSTINKDGSSQLTLVAYVLDDDETIVMNVELQSQKTKNMRRDHRIALCVQDGNRYVSVYGTMTFLDDQ